jgi:Ca2+-binding RTX toxin-like protein
LRRSLTLAVLLTLSACAEPAFATNVRVQGDTITVQAEAGQQNNVRITHFNPGKFHILDWGSSLTAGEGCAIVSGAAECSDGGVAKVSVELGDGDDIAEVGAGIESFFIVDGGAGDDVLARAWVSQGGSEIYGREGDDELIGSGRSADALEGGDGADAIWGDEKEPNWGGGDDTLRGGNGDDALYGDPGADLLSGGPGHDRVDYFRHAGGTITLDDLPDDGASAEGDNVGSDIEVVRGSGAADFIRGDEDANVIDGWWGSDEIAGGGGDDTLIAGDGADRLSGGGGDDLLRDYGSGPTSTWADVFAGGTGYDVADFVFRSEDLTITLNDVDDDGAEGEHDDVKSDVEEVIGGDGDDVLEGTAGADLLDGKEGDDILAGLAGDDDLYGGDGFDLVWYGERTVAVAAELDGLPGDGVAGEDDLIASDVEDLAGGAAGDLLVGNGHGNILFGGPGPDDLRPGGGEDLVFGEAGADVIAARDGAADEIECGADADAAVVDASTPSLLTASPSTRPQLRLHRPRRLLRPRLLLRLRPCRLPRRLPRARLRRGHRLHAHASSQGSRARHSGPLARTWSSAAAGSAASRSRTPRRCGRDGSSSNGPTQAAGFRATPG